MSCNPEGPGHWFYREWVRRAEEKKLFYLHFTMADNPSLSPQTRERYERAFRGTFYRRYVLGEWTAAQGLVYGFFLYRKQAALWRAIAAVLLITVVLNMGLNTLWLWILMKDGVWGILSTRIPKYFLVAPVQILVTRALSGRLTEQFRRLIAA